MKALLKLRQQLRQAELDYDAKVWNYTRQASASNEFRHFLLSATSGKVTCY
jgi:predicted LPLAT superfamily acyltransferase